MFQHINDLVELDDSGLKAWKLLRDVIQPNTLPMVIVLEKDLAALSMRPGDDVKPVLDKIKDTYARMAAAGSNVSQMQQTSGHLSGYGSRFCRMTSAGATRVVVLPTKLLRGMELQEAAEEEGEGEAEVVGEALAEGEAEVTTTRGMGALCFSRPEGWAPPGMKPPSGERARGGVVQGSGAQGKANPGMFLMVEDVKGSEGDVGSVGKVVMHPLTHWVIDSGCTSHMNPRAGLLDEVKPPGKIKFMAAASGALLPVIGVGNAKVMGANVLLVEEEKYIRIKDLWQLPIIPWNGKPPATAAAAATAKATTGGEETAPTDGALDAVKKVLQTQQPHGEVLAGVDATAAWAKASSRSGEADWETWHERLCHQNGVAERFNRTLQKGARTLLGRAGLPDPFWLTALQQVARVKNRVLATVGDKQWVPYTKWYGSAPAVNMLRIYGCMVVFHVPKEKRGKLEASGRWGVHLGLAKDHKGWLIWDLTSQQLTVSRDVKFLESLYYKEWKQQQQQKLPTTPLIIEDDEVVRAGSMAEQCDEDEIAHCYWATVSEPKMLAEALSGPDAEKWKQSVKEEYDSLLENETWELCELPLGKKAISSKLIFKHKYGPDGELTCYKSRLVAKGFQQTKGKDFDEIFAPVGKGNTLRVMLGTAANRGWRIKQMDITTAFPNGIILEELYMLQPEGLDDGSGNVCRLKKAIYGLKQAPRAWYHKLEETLLAGGFKKSECDHSLFLLQEKEQFLMLLVYMDDILLFSESSAMIERVEEMLEMQLKCSKMGDVKYYLEMHVERDLDKGVLRLHQRKYCEGLAEKYGLQDGGKPATPLPSGFIVETCADEEVVGESDMKLFHSMVGALNYAANHTRPLHCICYFQACKCGLTPQS
ncbi:unnamed protein product [Closterium sp. NIES-53]